LAVAEGLVAGGLEHAKYHVRHASLVNSEFGGCHVSRILKCGERELRLRARRNLRLVVDSRDPDRVPQLADLARSRSPKPKP
jgi:hypothetical protein